MSSLKEIKTRINSVRSTLKITSAMKMVAAAKLHKVQNIIGNKLPYEQQLRRTLTGMLEDDDLQRAIHDELGLGGPEKTMVRLHDVHMDEFPSKEDVDRVALVLFSSSSSLCGAFNANVIREFQLAHKALADRGYGPEDIDVYVIGRKIGEAAVRSGLTIKSDMSEMADNPRYEDAAELSQILVDEFVSGRVGQIILIYSHFATASSQPTLRENYLPLALHDLDVGAEPVDYILEPDPLSLARELLPMVLRLKLFTVLLDASAAEHAARTIAMQIASDNAKNLIAELTLAYNKGRQQEITAEILDLVGGTMA